MSFNGLYINARATAYLAYKCSECEWQGIAGLRIDMSHVELAEFFACPVHGDKTQMRKLDIQALRKR